MLSSIIYLSSLQYCDVGRVITPHLQMKKYVLPEEYLTG